LSFPVLGTASGRTAPPNFPADAPESPGRKAELERHGMPREPRRSPDSAGGLPWRHAGAGPIRGLHNTQF